MLKTDHGNRATVFFYIYIFNFYVIIFHTHLLLFHFEFQW